MDLIYTYKSLIDKGVLKNVELDMEIGLKANSRNDFELKTTCDYWDCELCEGSIIYIDKSEIGGMLKGIISNTKDNTITLKGHTWRGLIDKQIIEPTQGQSHFKARGDANGFLRDVLDNSFNGLIVGSQEVCGVNVNRDIRYENKLEAIENTLKKVGLRIEIKFDAKTKKAIVSAVPVETHEKEFSNDYGYSLIAKDIKDGYNHVICLGQGELTERQVVHLYRLSSGVITQDKAQALNDGISGINDRSFTYDFSSAEDLNALIDGGTKALQEKSDTKSLEIQNVENIEIGDIVGARERTTGIYMQKEIVSKIIKGKVENLSIENKVGD